LEGTVTSHQAQWRAKKLLAFLVVSLLALMFAQTATASLNEFKRIVGKVELSEDACGTNAPACTVEILKPSAAATVREADLFCATTGGSNYRPENDDVTLNGAAVIWDQIIPNGIQSFNARDDVTAIVKPVGDAAAPGLVVFTIAENPTNNYDGCILKVIWDDPTTTTNSILVYFGAQETAGDTFVINFAQPLDASSFTAPLEFSLGISFGAQGCAPGQFSLVDVNTVRLTSSAGGEDDGSCTNGALITVGGTGDSTTNPPPLAPPTAVPSIPDDELYDLRPFLSVGDTSMTVFTQNPSNNDNIFIANFFLRNVFVAPPPPAVLVLEPETDTNTAGEEHCVTATVTDAAGDPSPGITVQFSVSGANSATGSAVTDANGQATFCYTGTVAGTDTITAYADTNRDAVQDPTEPGDTATKIYVAGPPATLVLTPETDTNTVDDQHCVTATVRDAFGNPTPGITVRFSVTGPGSTSGSSTTNAAGQATFCYTSALPGTDVITAYADTDNDGVNDATEPEDTASKTWVIPASTPGCKVTYGGRITAANGDKATFGGNAKADGLNGQEEYQDHGPAADLNVHSIDVLSVVCRSDGTASIFGTATVNGSGTFDYRIDLKDMGEPGDLDTYRIRLSSGYDSGEQILEGGNVQIH
jgi:hypothetical protein